MIRPAATGEADRIAAVYLESWRAAYGPLVDAETLNRELARRAEYDWEASIRGESETRVFVAVDGENVVAVLELTPRDARTDVNASIEMLYALPTHWGRGVATELLQFAETLFYQEGFRSARLEVVEPQARARRFYERQGWARNSEAPLRSNGMFNILLYERKLGTSRDA